MVKWCNYPRNVTIFSFFLFTQSPVSGLFSSCCTTHSSFPPLLFLIKLLLDIFIFKGFSYDCIYCDPLPVYMLKAMCCDDIVTWGTSCIQYFIVCVWNHVLNVKVITSIIILIAILHFFFLSFFKGWGLLLLPMFHFKTIFLVVWTKIFCLS